MNSIHKYLLCLAGLLAPLGILADNDTPAEFADNPTWYDFRDASFSIGTSNNGTFYSPIIISTPEQLAQLAWLVNVEGKSYAGRVFNLGADINLKKEVDGKRVQWIPIGYDSDKPFDGMFLGLEHSMQKATWQEDYSHTVSGMYINVSYPYPDSRTRNLGLFGCVRGFIGFFRLTDCSITTSVYKFNPDAYFDAFYHNANIGLLCGQAVEDYDLNENFQYEEFNTHYFKAPSAIYDAAVEGSISVTSPYNYAVGGICGAASNRGICHSTAKVDISYADAYVRGKDRYSLTRIGGICGSLEKADFQIQRAAIVDCAADVNVTSYDESTIKAAGGIVGEMNANTQVAACTSSGYMTVMTNKFNTDTGNGLGGICGIQNNNARIQGCASSATLDGPAYVGGIVGAMTGLPGNPGDPLVDACMFSGVISSFLGTKLGGIVGVLNEDGEAEGLYINGSLFAGTFQTTLSTNVAAIASSVPKAAENVGGCYYDEQLFQGNVIGEDATHASIRGLTTDEFTLGLTTPFSMLPCDESAQFGFVVARGYYPTVFCNIEWPGYSELKDNYVNLSNSYEYWKYANVEKSNTVYRTGAWSCAVPVSIPKGDTAYDLVTKVIAPEKNYALAEPERTVNVNSRATYPNLSCIRISNDTAYAVANGSFTVTLTMRPKTTEVVRNRPLPINATRRIAFDINIDQVWDGTIATDYAAGTGIKEDPYIIKNGAQLAFAILHNYEGEWFEQLCDITLNKDLLDNEGRETVEYTPNYWIDNNPYTGPWGDKILWKAQYDGKGHFIKGARIARDGYGVFGNVEESGSITNLGIIDSTAPKSSGLFAGSMDGSITNCIAQGALGSLHPREADYYMNYCGGFASIVGKTNANAVIEDCISSAFCPYFFEDVTPFVSLSSDNLGKVRNCLSVVPMIYADKDLNPSGITASGKRYIENCYWLKGYEEMNTGFTLEEICSALGSRSQWKIFNGYLPTLKVFAETDMAKLLMVPFRTDEDYSYDGTGGSDNYLLGFGKQLLFEPGTVNWTSTDENESYFETDSEMGIIVPKKASFVPSDIIPGSGLETIRVISGLYFINGFLGKYHHLIPVRTRRGAVNPGISFVDDNARDACLEAFDSNHDDVLSLAELKAVTTEQTLSAFQTTTARNIEQFPEFRFFKTVKKLTTQLNGLTNLEKVQLPYALEILGSDAFDGCTSLTEVTIPAKVDWIEPHPFYGSAIENVYVDPFNENYVSRDGILFDPNDKLVAYPNGRSGEEAIINGTIGEISEGAIYKVDGLRQLYFETDDYETVPYLNVDGIVSDNGELIDVYVSDATYGSVLMEGYYNDGSWDEYIEAGKLHCYYPLYIGNAKAGTLYIGFPTELPAELKPYIVTETDADEKTAYLKRMPQQVPDRTPIVVFANEAGLYRLMPTDQEIKPWAMYKNELNGVGRDGMYVNQGDSDRGQILTLGRNSSGTLGFFYFKGGFIQPYRAYLTYNFVQNPSARFTFIIDDELPTGLGEAVPYVPNLSPLNSGAWYTLDGRRLSGKPAVKGIYIWQGKKVVIR